MVIDENITVIRQMFAALQALTLEEKRILTDFEHRIGSLYRHERLVRKLVRELQVCRTKTNMHARTVKTAAKVEATLRKGFACFPANLQQLAEKNQALVQRRLARNIHKFDEVQKISGEAAKSIVQSLQRLIILDNEGQKLADAFAKNILTMKGAFDEQKHEVASELAILQEIRNSDITEQKISRWIMHLQQSNVNVKVLLLQEKSLLHEPLYVLIQQERRTERRALRLLKKNKIKRKVVVQDIKTFSKPEEFFAYADKLTTYGNLSYGAEKLLRRGYRGALAAAETRSVHLQMLRIHTFVDMLSGVFNRRHVERKGAEVEALLHRRALARFAVLMIDVDNFKQYNDTYGHQVGDAVLKKVAELVRLVPQRRTDTIGRYGGDELIVILPYESGARNIEKGVLSLAESIRAVVERERV